MSNYPPNYDQSLGSVPNQQLSSSQGVSQGLGTNEQPIIKKSMGEWATGEPGNSNKDWLGGHKQPVAPLSTQAILSGESSLLHQQGQGGGVINRIMHPQQQQQQQQPYLTGEKSSIPSDQHRSGGLLSNIIHPHHSTTTSGVTSSGSLPHDQRDQFYPQQQVQQPHSGGVLSNILHPHSSTTTPLGNVPYEQQVQQQQQPYVQQQQQPIQQQQQPHSGGMLGKILHHNRSSSTSSTGNSTIAPTTDTTTATTPKKGGILSGLFGHKRQSSASHSSSTSSSTSTAPQAPMPVGAGMGSGMSGIMANVFGTDVSRGVVHNEGVTAQPPVLSGQQQQQPLLQQQQQPLLQQQQQPLLQQQQQPLMSGVSAGPSVGPSSGLATGVGTGLATGVGTGLISHNLSNDNLNNNKSNVPTSPMVGSTQNVLARISGKLSPFHSLSARDASGQLISFSELVGRPVLIVNVALESRLANQFGGLQALYEKYRNQGFEILAFPCDQFGGSAPGTSLELRDLIMRNFGVTFPIMEKVDVDGLGTHPVFRYLKSQKSNILIEAVKWNFEKFLIDGNGNVIERWNSSAGVEAIEPHIARLLL